MTSIKQLVEFFESYTPFELAESWDNVGLLIGDSNREISTVMTCLTVTSDVVSEAQSKSVDVLITHHPIPFQPLKKITADSTTGHALLRLIESKIAVISPHTSFDSAASGINQLLAEKIGLESIKPLIPLNSDQPAIGKGRFGKLSSPENIESFAARIKQTFGLNSVKTVSESGQTLDWIGIACGSGGSFLDDVLACGCNAMLTGEASFHTCLEARSRSVALVLLGHYVSERFALELLASRLATEFPALNVFASKNESDPIRWL